MKSIGQPISFRTITFFIAGLFAIMPFFCAHADEQKKITADDLVYLTENFPPHNFEKQGELTGASVEILELIWQKLNCSKKRNDIQLIPWARAIKRLENEPNIVLFGMGFTVERIKKFHWVGPYYNHSLALIAKKDQQIKIHHVEDAKNILIGVVRDDIGNQMLINMGFRPENLDLSGDIETLFNKARFNRFKVICYVEHAFFNYVETNHPEFAATFEPVFQISNMRSGYGFSKAVPKSLIENFQSALDQLKKEGEIGPILKKYHMD